MNRKPEDQLHHIAVIKSWCKFPRTKLFISRILGSLASAENVTLFPQELS